jgi:hypothetical protein
MKNLGASFISWRQFSAWLVSWMTPPLISLGYPYMCARLSKFNFIESFHLKRTLTNFRYHLKLKLHRLFY